MKILASLETDKKSANFTSYTAFYQNISVSSCLFSYLIYYFYAIILYMFFLPYVFEDHEVKFSDENSLSRSG